MREEYLEDFIPLAKKEMERPINFLACSLPRRYLKIPCDVEIGHNYKDLIKFKSTVSVAPVIVPESVRTRPLTVTEQFTVTDEEVRDEIFRKRDEIRTNKLVDEDIPF